MIMSIMANCDYICLKLLQYPDIDPIETLLSVGAL